VWSVTFIGVVAKMSVQQVLDRKEERVIAIPADAPMSGAIEVLSEEFVGTVMLTGQDGRLAGILSERDIIRAIHQYGDAAFSMPAEKLMVPEVVSCTPEMSIEGVLSLMSANTIRHVPVVRDGRILGLISVRDVLDLQKELLIADAERRKRQQQETERAKEELERAYDGLEAKIEERTRELSTARDAAEQANRSKSELLANISHELRTPLVGIIGFSEILQNEKFGPLGGPQYVEYAGDINQAGQHLLALINNLLDLSKIESGKGELFEAYIDVRSVIGATIRMLGTRSAEKSVTVDCDVAPDVPALLADEGKVKQVLTNLLGNAIKFTEPRGRVTVKAWARGDSGYVIQISDTGIGIAPDAIPKALAQFGQVDSPLNRKYEGTGLGLPLAKSLMELHGGCLDLQSEVGVGTTVTVRFPVSRLCRERSSRNLIAAVGGE
jgi:signal transduction histidine kinase